MKKPSSHLCNTIFSPLRKAENKIAIQVSYLSLSQRLNELVCLSRLGNKLWKIFLASGRDICWNERRLLARNSYRGRAE